MTYAILRESLHGGFHYVKKDRGSEVFGAVGDKSFYERDFGYALKDQAETDASLLQQENEKQVEATRRRKTSRVFPARFTVVEITPEFLSNIDEKIAASPRRGDA